jgi:hypothetical protein
VKRKTEIVLRLLRGEELDALSREHKLTAATIAGWRDEFLAAGAAGLKSRAPTPEDDEVLRLKAMVGDLTMRNELLTIRARYAETGELPFRSRKPKT